MPLMSALEKGGVVQFLGVPPILLGAGVGTQVPDCAAALERIWTAEGG